MRSLLAPLAVLLAFALSAHEARADGERASAICERVAGPGRVRCDLELVVPGARIAWADVQVVDTPLFVTALKGRIGPADVSQKERERWRFSFGLVARARGAGDVHLRARAVACRPNGDQERCETIQLPVTAAVSSGER
ncbi:MAG: hypothetical protein IPG50_29660 [Myxococcales bacterium]|nr:hypothetical protein [Myxococcales bacterium]